MKKSNYINKYDYISYYTKQKAFWFFSNSEINAAINTELKKLNIDNDINSDDEDDIDEDFDAYEYYKEQKELLINIDKNDPKIIEGIIIDKKSRQFIIEKYHEIKTIIDFEQESYKNIKQEEIAKITKNLILENKEIILFQPVFIHNNLITKPDAIIRIDNEIILIETKSTTTSKRHHFLDIYFQNKILTSIDYLQDFYFDLNLCLVAYCYANKNEVNFITTNAFNINASISIPKEIDISIKQLLKLGQGVLDKLEYFDSAITFNNTCNDDFSDLEQRKNLLQSFSKSRTIKYIEIAQEEIIKISNEFNTVIKKLLEHKKNLKQNNLDFIQKIEISPNEKSYWKKSDIFNKLKEIYYKQGHILFKYSGTIIHQNADAIKQYLLNSNKNISTFFKKSIYESYFNNNKLIKFNSTLNNFIHTLKSKKVYFDFETINSPIRPIDNCLPFMQILTQCSIIVDNNSLPIDKIQCNNILIDPINITIDDFKHVIDSIYQGSKYSYVVYNKTFECSRLNEMANFINEEQYRNKVKIIIENIYDLADFFKVNSKNPALIIPELYGYYSIKKVLPLVMKYRYDIFNKTGCVDYHDLDIVQNGLICQSETTKRFHHILNQEEWDKLSINLKKYCENDVRAMIAVEYYIKSLI